MEIQDGVIYDTSVAYIKGTLYKLLEVREVGHKGWKVRDMILQTKSTRGNQFRLVQVSGVLLDEVRSIAHGSEIICEINLLGKEVTNHTTHEIKYRNLDEVTKIVRV